MKHLILALCLAAPAYAGGPVVPTEEPEVIAPERPNVLPIILGLVLLGLALNAGGGDEPDEPCKKNSGGCE